MFDLLNSVAVAGGYALLWLSWALARALYVASALWRMPPARTVANAMTLIGHRGASAEWPENTLRAMLAALDAGAQGVEYDLQQLADGTLVVLHDGTLRRTARPASPPVVPSLLDTPVSQLRLADVAAVDVGGERLPTFERLIRSLVTRYPDRISFAELKAGANAAMVAEAVRVVRTTGAGPAAVVFISFDEAVCAGLKQLAREYRVLLLAFCASERAARRCLERACELGLDGINISASPATATPALARDVHARGLWLATWVFRAPAANDTEAVWRCMHRGDVDFLTTNLPAPVWAWARGANGTRPHLSPA
jgi:glycerophosphoryl diester phosphodiesterase